jgi:hypothetical protein
MGHARASIVVMRTRLDWPDDVYPIVPPLADAQGISMGAAVAELVRQALNPAVRINN